MYTYATKISIIKYACAYKHKIVYKIKLNYKYQDCLQCVGYIFDSSFFLEKPDLTNLTIILYLYKRSYFKCVFYNLKHNLKTAHLFIMLNNELINKVGNSIFG